MGGYRRRSGSEIVVVVFKIKGQNKLVEFGSFRTSGASILVHSLIYFLLVSLFLLAIGLHLYVGS